MTRGRLATLTVLLAAFALRLALLDFQELRGDEAFGYFFIQRSYADLTTATIDLREPHPLASYYLAKGWLALGGDSEFSLRFLPAWFGVLAVALTGRLARRLGLGQGTSLTAAVLLAISPYTVWHSQDARMYSMSLALTTATVWLALELLQRQRLVWGLAYVGSAWLALHTHYYATFVLGALNLFVLGRALWVPSTRPNLLPWLGWQLAVGGLYLPWLTQVAGIVGGYSGNGDSPGFLAMLERSLAVFAVGESTPAAQRPFWATLAALSLLLGGLKLWLGRPAERRALGLLLCYLAIPVLAIWVSAWSRPIFNERYLVASAPPFALLAAAALGGRPFPKQTRTVLLTALLTVLLTALLAGASLGLTRYYQDPAYSKTRGWRLLAAEFDVLGAGVPTHAARIAQNFPDPTLWYYYRGPIEHVVLPPAPHAAAEAQIEVEKLALSGVRRVLLPLQPAPNWDADQLAVAALTAGGYTQIAERQTGVWPLQIWTTADLNQPTGVEDGDFPNGVRLLGMARLDPALPGGILAPTLWLQVPQSLMGNTALKITVQLLDGTGQLAAQQDRPLAGGQSKGTATLQTFGLALPPDLAPGRYRLIAALYDSESENMPRVHTLGGAEAVQLGNATVLAP